MLVTLQANPDVKKASAKSYSLQNGLYVIGVTFLSAMAGPRRAHGEFSALCDSRVRMM
jgi:DNA-binding IclR family transcriptional regulator